MRYYLVGMPLIGQNVFGEFDAGRSNVFGGLNADWANVFVGLDGDWLT